MRSAATTARSPAPPSASMPLMCVGLPITARTASTWLGLCILHHTLFDRGVFSLDPGLCVRVSRTCTTRTDAGRAIYDLHGPHPPRHPATGRGPRVLALAEMFKGQPLTRSLRLSPRAPGSRKPTGSCREDAPTHGWKANAANAGWSSCA